MAIYCRYCGKKYPTPEVAICDDCGPDESIEAIALSDDATQVLSELFEDVSE